MLAGRRLFFVFFAAFALAMLHGSVAFAAGAGRVAVLAPDHDPLWARLTRNFADSPALLTTATVKTCSRDVVARLLDELDAETAICTDGDVVSIWHTDRTELSLVDAMPIVSKDDRAFELLAARATIAARNGVSPASPLSFTISSDGRVGPVEAPPAPRVEKPAAPPARLPRVAPRMVLGAGPAVLASGAGAAFGMSFNADIAVSRTIALAPWFTTAIVAPEASGEIGSASYRPTLIGLGIAAPLSRITNLLVPRLGAGYAILWVHVWPETAVAPAQKKSESLDMFGAVMYATAALSMKLGPRTRLTAEAMLGVSSHELIVRLDRERTSWGVPLAHLALRGEVVF